MFLPVMVNTLFVSGALVPLASYISQQIAILAGVISTENLTSGQLEIITNAITFSKLNAGVFKQNLPTMCKEIVQEGDRYRIGAPGLNYDFLFQTQVNRCIDSITVLMNNNVVLSETVVEQLTTSTRKSIYQLDTKTQELEIFKHPGQSISTPVGDINWVHIGILFTFLVPILLRVIKYMYPIIKQWMLRPTSESLNQIQQAVREVDAPLQLKLKPIIVKAEKQIRKIKAKKVKKSKSRSRSRSVKVKSSKSYKISG